MTPVATRVNLDITGSMKQHSLVAAEASALPSGGGARSARGEPNQSSADCRERDKPEHRDPISAESGDCFMIVLAPDSQLRAKKKLQEKLFPDRIWQKQKLSGKNIQRKSRVRGPTFK